MGAVVVIPARYGSTRFTAKVVAAETGRPLVQHVVDRAKSAKKVGRVIVATDDPRVADALAPFGTDVVLTGVDHQSGTDRIAEVASRLTDEIIVNVQGDEPEIEPEVIDELVGRMSADPSLDMATAATEFPAAADPLNPNLVKVAIGLDGRAVYFSRCPIPFHRDKTTPPAYHLHLGIYAFRRRFLLQYASWAPTPLESAEKLEQLRALEHGRSIYVQVVRRATHGIDTPEQYEAFVARYRGASVDGSQ